MDVSVREGWEFIIEIVEIIEFKENNDENYVPEERRIRNTEM